MRESLEIWLPLANMALIVVSGVFLLIGYTRIRRGDVVWHKRSMLTAAVFAALFLVVYVTRVAVLPAKLFPAESGLRGLYFSILIPHTIVATLVAPFAFVTIRRALAGRFAKHRAIARITFPMWLFTAISGYVVYWMLYQM